MCNYPSPKIITICLIIKNLFMTNFYKKCLLTFDDLWNLNYEPEFKFDKDKSFWTFMSFRFFSPMLIGPIVPEIFRSFYSSLSLGIRDLCWPLVTSILTWSQKCQHNFKWPCRELSNAVFCVSLAFLVFELEGAIQTRFNTLAMPATRTCDHLTSRPRDVTSRPIRGWHLLDPRW